MADEKIIETNPETVEKSDLEKKLMEFGATPETIAAMPELGVTEIEDLALLNESDLVGAGMKVVQARKLLNNLKPKPPVEEPKAADTTPTGPAVSTFFSTDSILPSVPADEAWLSSLKTGGILKVDQATYISAIRAAIADRANLYDVPEKLMEALEEYSYEKDESVDPDFYKLMNQLTRRNYGDLFAAIDGLNGTFISAKRKKTLLERINSYLWPAVINCYQQLCIWRQTWADGYNPMFFVGHQYGAPLPPGMAQAPDTSPLQDAGDELRNALNKSLAGTGSVVASAMAYEFGRTMSILNDSSLPNKVGAANREQLYKRLGLSVDASLARAEVNIVRFVMSFAQADSVTADAAAGYYSALYMLGSQINWAQLGLKAQPTDGIRNFGGDTL